MTQFLQPEQKASLDALLPLVKLNDGELHLTTSLPESVFETPAHLDYVCARLAETRPKAETQSGKFRRMRVISRKLRMSTYSFDDCRRFNGQGGPQSKMMWSLTQHDDMQRMSGPLIKFASTGDESKIYRRFYRLVVNAVSKTAGIDWWRGGNDDVHAGRYYPIPKQPQEHARLLADLRSNLEQKGFELTIVAREK